MNILVIGAGGREHALAWKAAQSPLATRVYVAPGNAGTALEPDIENVPLDMADHAALIRFAREHDIGLTIVGPEAPLVAGIVDDFRAAGLTIFGPTQAAAELEGSKAFTKDFLARHRIPSAFYGVFTDVDPAVDYIRAKGAPIVVKADGLAAGKGVILAQTEAEAEAAVNDMLAGNRFGEAGARVVVEEFLQGEEASFIVMVDGDHILPMATSQDHKAALNGDTGPNTGGMGAYSPAPVVTPALTERVLQEVIRPTVDGMKAEGRTYTGFLYAGLMIAADGTPNVLEYNCRFGDPETQPIMLRLESDLVEHCLAACRGELEQQTARWSEQPALGVVMAAGGYPDSYRKGDVVKGLEQAAQLAGKVFHAGTALNTDAASPEVLTAGGRVLCCTARGDSVSAAQQAAYAQVEAIRWADCYYRTDIGHRAIARERG
ncbi:phosphoribosylamine--glycine ligase [Natronospirillum operosum]|uniref:Phosphoribosylamine--glycine ligase n=1 Tax=Natronospirillum operosum TaxID=2759953 RepID=A0A4Z0WHZ5_9GAMM|nr:phosphoribosylamine--glycine ligase [Natronospirillum operosum]TGG94983.1 phosphoribosylamine--glycine ligase [Natronospirillum operosum]